MADFSPTGYWAHFGVPAEGRPLIHVSLPVVDIGPANLARVIDRSGSAVEACLLPKFLHISPFPEG